MIGGPLIPLGGDDDAVVCTDEGCAVPQAEVTSPPPVGSDGDSAPQPEGSGDGALPPRGRSGDGAGSGAARDTTRE